MNVNKKHVMINQDEHPTPVTQLQSCVTQASCDSPQPSKRPKLNGPLIDITNANVTPHSRQILSGNYLTIETLIHLLLQR